MQTQRFQAWDINTNTLLTELPATNVSYSERLNDYGEFSCTLGLVDPDDAAQTAVIMALDGNPFKFLVTTNDNATIDYVGIAWTGKLTAQSTDVTIGGKSLGSYFNQVTSPKDYLKEISPADLMAAVVADTQAQAHADIHVGTRRQIGNQPPALLPTYHADQHTFSGQILSDVTASMAEGIGGVDFYFEHAFVGGVPRHTMVICAPRAGQTGRTSGHTINLDAAIDWEWPWDNTRTGNHVVVVGAGSGSSQPTATIDTTLPVGGLGQAPRLDQVLQYNQISDKGQLALIARGEVAAIGTPVTTPTITLPVDYTPLPLGAFNVGDDVRVTAAPQPKFPLGKDELWRIVANTVTIPTAGVSTYKVTLNPPPVF